MLSAAENLPTALKIKPKMLTWRLRPSVATPLPSPSLLSILRVGQGLSGWGAATSTAAAPELAAPACSSQPGPRLHDFYLLKILMVPFSSNSNSLTRVSRIVCRVDVCPACFYSSEPHKSRKEFDGVTKETPGSVAMSEHGHCPTNTDELD